MRNEKMKDVPGIMLYNDTLETLRFLPGDKLKIMLDAIINYHLRKEEPVLEESLMYLWPMIRHHLDIDAQHYEDTCIHRRINGLIGSFKKSYAPNNGIDPKDSAAMEEYLLSKGITEEQIAHSTQISICQQVPADACKLSQ